MSKTSRHAHQIGHKPTLAMHHDEPCGPPHGDQEERHWQPQPPPQEDHLENYLQRGSLDAEEKHALMDMIASVAQRISPSWRDYRIVRHRARTALIHYIQNIDEADIRWAHGPAREPEYRDEYQERSRSPRRSRSSHRTTSEVPSPERISQTQGPSPCSSREALAKSQPLSHRLTQACQHGSLNHS